jgi:CheY-like chemotaxis protein
MPKTVLLVEDSKRDAEAFRILFRSVGVSNPIVTLNDGARAIAYLEGKGEFADRDKYPLPSILLLDLRMPDIDGFDVLEWMKGRPHLNHILTVVLSAYDGIREVTHAYSLGAKSFLVKPLNRLDVQNLLKAFPEHWELTQSERPQSHANGG